jgi:hypothetical protein
VFVVVIFNGIQPLSKLTSKVGVISGSIHICLENTSVPQLLVTDKVAVYVPGELYACVWFVMEFVLLTFTIVPSPKSHLKLAAVEQFGLSPITELFVKIIGLFIQLISVESNLDTDGSKITILFIVDSVIEHAFSILKTAMN